MPPEKPRAIEYSQSRSSAAVRLCLMWQQIKMFQ